MSKHQPAGQPTGGQFAVDAKAENGTALARESMVGGVDLTGTPQQIRDSAMKAISAAETIYEAAGVMSCAQDVLAVHPNAVYLELNDSDQEGSCFTAGQILDASGTPIADFEDFEDDHSGLISDIPGRIPAKAIVAADGTVTAEGDVSAAYLEIEGNRRQGYTGLLNLKAAADTDLTALFS